MVSLISTALLLAHLFIDELRVVYSLRLEIAVYFFFAVDSLLFLCELNYVL